MSSILSLDAFKISPTPWFVLDVRSPEEYAQGSQWRKNSIIVL